MDFEREQGKRFFDRRQSEEYWDEHCEQMSQDARQYLKLEISSDKIKKMPDLKLFDLMLALQNAIPLEVQKSRLGPQEEKMRTRFAQMISRVLKKNREKEGDGPKDFPA